MATRGYENFTMTDIAQRQQKATPKPSKYNNKKTTVDGVTFDSAKEANRWNELRMLEKAGQIRYLERQPKFDLTVRNVVIGSYIADFRYERREPIDTGYPVLNWAIVIEDVKGMRGLPLYLWKIKHFNAQYGLYVIEIR